MWLETGLFLSPSRLIAPRHQCPARMLVKVARRRHKPRDPVLVLHRPNMGTKQRTTQLGELIETQAILDEPPGLINDLCSCLTQCFPHGSLWAESLTKLGDCQMSLLQLTFTRLFWRTTLSCRTPCLCEG